MTNDQYFPLEANMMHNDEICGLIEEMGMEGWGIYLSLLIELRKRDGYKCNMKSLWSIAHILATGQEKVNRVICDFSLFSIVDMGEKTVFSSPYLDRVMEKLEERREKCSKAGKVSGQKRRKKRTDVEHPLNDLPTEEKSKEEKSKEEKRRESSSSEEEVVAIPIISDTPFLNPTRPWREYINEAVGEQSWMELQAIISGFGLNFFKYRDIIVEAFINHVRTQGNEYKIFSLREAKSYFANFIRSGTPTNKRVSELLDKEIENEQKDNPYRYETIDPVTHARSYCGIPIPPDAPPRPSENAVWNLETFTWSK